MKKFFVALSFILLMPALLACNMGKVEELSNSKAKNFRISRYSDGYVVEVFSAWEGQQKNLKYLLYRTKKLQKDKNCSYDAQIQIPIKRLVAFSTSYLSAIKELHQQNSIIATVDGRYISDPELIERIEKKQLLSLGYPPRPEKIISLHPDVIMAFVSESAELEGVSKLQQLALPVVFNADYREKHPLGRAEWVRFLGAFYDQLNDADSFYKNVEANYQKSLAKVTKITKRPKVLLGEKRGSAWVAPGGASYLRRFVEEAGGEYIFESDQSNYPQQLPFERILQSLSTLDIWITFGPWLDAKQIFHDDDRYHLFKRPSLRIFAGNKILGKNGGNDYFETGAMRPDKVLEDFIMMIHPELNEKTSTLTWFIPLNLNEGK